MNSTFKATLKKAFQYLFQGLIVIAPIAITIYFVYWLFTLIDDFLPDMFGRFFPQTFEQGSHIPGVGFLLVIILLILIGRASSTFVFSHFFDMLGGILEKTPGIKLIYSSIKDFLGAFSGNEKKFDKPVLVNVDADEVWRIGFITQTDAGRFDMVDHVVVYVPLSYAISGITFLVPKSRIQFIKKDIPSAEAMKFVLSGGVTILEKGNEQ